MIDLSLLDSLDSLDYRDCEDRLGVFPLHSDVIIPKSATRRSGCIDLHAYIANDAGSIAIDPGQTVLVPTGLVFDIPEDYCVLLYARSGLACKRGVNLANGVGYIDEDYVEEVFVPLHNMSKEIAIINHGDRIAQASLQLCHYNNEVVILKERPDKKSSRSGGFGSTGV